MYEEDNFEFPNVSEFITFQIKNEAIFIRRSDISFVHFYYDKEANNQLKAKIVLNNGKSVIHHFHKNNYNDYKQLTDVLMWNECMTEEEWHKTMKVSYK